MSGKRSQIPQIPDIIPSQIKAFLVQKRVKFTKSTIFSKSSNI
jgi:hypothetical protein